MQWIWYTKYQITSLKGDLTTETIEQPAKITNKDIISFLIRIASGQAWKVIKKYWKAAPIAFTYLF